MDTSSPVVVQIGSQTDSGIAALQSYTESFISKMRLTKGARFETARRHQSRSVSSIWSVVLLSIYLFSVTCVLVVFDFTASEGAKALFTLLNVIMSAFIIVFSVIEQGKRHDLKAEMFLRCAQGIGELYDKVELNQKLGTITAEKLFAWSDEYSKLINDFTENHSDIDYMKYRQKNRHYRDPSRVRRFWIDIRYLIDCWFLLWISASVPLLIILGIFVYADQSSFSVAKPIAISTINAAANLK